MIDDTLKNLNKNIIEVHFKKINGELRIMKCTTNLNLIPTDKHPKTSTKSYENDTTYRVFDIVINEWRSFKKDNVVEARIIE